MSQAHASRHKESGGRLTRRDVSQPLYGNGRMFAPLAGATVLLAEDEAFLALDLHDTLEEAGARVIGPVASLSDALVTAKDRHFDAAILDIDLQGKEVFPVAALLAEKRIPFVFHTAHGRAAQLCQAFAQVPVCSKPTDPTRLIRVLCALLENRRAGE